MHNNHSYGRMNYGIDWILLCGWFVILLGWGPIYWLLVSIKEIAENKQDEKGILEFQA